MSIDSIKYVAWTKFFMEFVTMTKLSGHEVMVFKSGEKSDVDGFISCFGARRVYDKHNEDELYGVIV